MNLNTTHRGFWGAVLPFVPVAVGIALKFSLFDKPTTDLPTHFKTTYITGIWIDFVVTAYISGIAWLLSRKRDQTIDSAMVVVLLVVPAVALVLCVLLALGAPKAGAGEFFSLYLPALIAALSLALSGNALATA